MKPYLFVFEAQPKPDNPQTKDIGGACASIIVFSESINCARETSVRFIDQYGWQAKEEQYALELPPSQIAHLDTVLSSVYRKAEMNGISAQFDAWPKKDRPGVYSFETLMIPRKKE